MVAEVEGELHAGVPAPDDEDLLAAVLLAGLVLAGVDDVAGEFPEAVDVRDDALGVLAGGDDEPAADVLGLGAGRGGGGA